MRASYAAIAASMAAVLVYLSFSVSGCGHETEEQMCRYNTTCATSSCHCVEVDPMYCHGGQALSSETQEIQNETTLWLTHSTAEFGVVANVNPGHEGWTMCNLSHAWPCSSSSCPSNELTSVMANIITIFTFSVDLLTFLVVLATLLIFQYFPLPRNNQQAMQQAMQNFQYFQIAGMGCLVFKYWFDHFWCAIGVALYVQMHEPLAEAVEGLPTSDLTMMPAFLAGSYMARYPLISSFRNIVVAQLALFTVWDLPLLVWSKIDDKLMGYALKKAQSFLLGSQAQVETHRRVSVAVWALIITLLSFIWGSMAVRVAYTPSSIAIAGHHVIILACWNLFLTLIKETVKAAFLGNIPGMKGFVAPKEKELQDKPGWVVFLVKPVMKASKAYDKAIPNF